MAGCIDDAKEPQSLDGFDPSAPLPPDTTLGLSQTPYPLLAELDGRTLRESAAEMIIPAGEYRLLRIVLTPDMWGDEQPWGPDTGRIFIGLDFRMEGNGTFMSAAPRDEQFDNLDVFFLPIKGSSFYVGGWGYCGMESPPKNEEALLLGSKESTIHIRVGILEPPSASKDSCTALTPPAEFPDALWNRSSVPFRADASTPHAFAGIASRVAGETTYLAGIMDATWDPATQDGTSVQRTSHYEAHAEAGERGVFFATMGGLDWMGTEQWSYTLDAPGIAGAWEGAWIHSLSIAPLVTAPMDGPLAAPSMQAQGIIDAGPVHFQAERSFTGQNDPMGAVVSQEGAVIGYAGVDLEYLFGWDVSHPPESNGTPGTLHCSWLEHTPLLRDCGSTMGIESG